MNSFEIGLLIFLSTMCIFTVINRICTCIENCVMSKNYEKYLKHKDNSEKTIDLININRD